MHTPVTLDQISRLLDEKLEEVLDRKLEEKFTEKLAPIHKILKEHTIILSKHSKILNEHSKMLDEHAKTLKNHGKKLASLKKDQGVILNFLDRQSIKSERRLDRIEGYLGLPPLPPVKYALRERAKLMPDLDSNQD